MTAAVQTAPEKKPFSEEFFVEIITCVNEKNLEGFKSKLLELSSDGQIRVFEATFPDVYLNTKYPQDLILESFINELIRRSQAQHRKAKSKDEARRFQKQTGVWEDMKQIASLGKNGRFRMSA